MAEPVHIRRLEIEGSRTSFKPEQNNNIHLLYRGRKAVLVDGCYDHEQAWQEIDEGLAGYELTDILVTHFHPDHAQIAAKVREKYGARLWANPGETRIGPHVRAEEIDNPITEDGRIETGAGITLDAVVTPGHTLWHTCFYLPDTRTLFSGDHIIGEGTPWVGPPHGNVKDYLASLLKVRELDLSEIRGGHGPLIDQPYKKIDEYYEHRMMRERQILELLDEKPRRIPEMVETIYADVDRRVWALARLVVRGHLDKLIAEERVSEDPADNEPIFSLR